METIAKPLIIFSALFLIFNKLSYSQCSGTCGNGSICMNGYDWYNWESFTAFDYKTSNLNSITGNNKDIIAITDVKYVTYKNDSKETKYPIDDKNGPTYSMDIYFPRSFYPNNLNKYSGPTYPVLFFLPGGGFIGVDKSDTTFTEFCKRFAAKGMVVVTIDYRTDPSRPNCNPYNNSILVMTVQDLRMAMRTIEAITDGAYSYANNLGQKIYLPFIDDTRIVVGGNSAGSFIALTTAFYDACDINNALNANNELGNTNINPYTLGSANITCEGQQISMPFNLDESDDNNYVNFFFPDSSGSIYKNAPINNILTVIDLKGAVPEEMNNYTYTSSNCENKPCDGEGNCDPNCPSVLPQFVANNGDNIPVISFHSIQDGVVPYSNNFETYTTCPQQVGVATCASQFCNVGSGFEFGSEKIAAKLQLNGICSQLYGESGSTHDSFEVDKKPFIVTQSTLFIRSVLASQECGKQASCVMTTEEDITAKDDKSFIGLQDCDTKELTVDEQFTIENNNEEAILTQFDVKPELFLNGLNVIDYFNTTGYNFNSNHYATLQITNANGIKGKNYLLPGESMSITLTGLKVTTLNGSSYKAQITLCNIDGWTYEPCKVGCPSNTCLSFTTNNTSPSSKSFSSCPARTNSFTSDSSLLIYPNPFEETFRINLPDSYCTIQIISLDGNLIESAFCGTDRYLVTGRNLKPGVYLLKVVSTNSTYLAKIIKL